MASLIAGQQNSTLYVGCPYCSNRYDCTAIEDRDGKQVAVLDFRKAPSDCGRCGSPMEPGEKAQLFQDRMAEKEANNYGPGIGKIVEVPKRPRRGVSLEPEDDDGDSKG